MLNKRFFIIIILLSFAIVCARQDSAASADKNSANNAAITQTEEVSSTQKEEEKTETEDEEDEEDDVPAYIMEIRKLFKSGTYNIYNNDDLKKIADKLTPEQLLDLGKDIESNNYYYIFINIDKSKYTGEQIVKLYDELASEFYFMPYRGVHIPYSALFFYEEAAKQGNAEAQYMYGINMVRGDEPSEWLKTAFEKKFPDAVKMIVDLCLPTNNTYQCGEYNDDEGHGYIASKMLKIMPLDAKHCTKYIEDAYKQNLAKPYHLAVHYYYNVKDYKKTIQYIHESLEYFKTPHQDKDSEYKYFDDNNYNEIYVYSDASRNYSYEGQNDRYWQSIINYLLGNLYYYGYEYQQDYKKALENYKQAAGNEYYYGGYMLPDASLKTAYMYKYGLGTEIDLNKSKKYLEGYNCECNYIKYIGNEKEYSDLCLEEVDNSSSPEHGLEEFVYNLHRNNYEEYRDLYTLSHFLTALKYKETKEYKDLENDVLKDCKNEDECNEIAQQLEKDIEHTLASIFFFSLMSNTVNPNPVVKIYKRASVLTIETKTGFKLDVSLYKSPIDDKWDIVNIDNPEETVFKWIIPCFTSIRACYPDLIKTIYGEDADTDIDKVEFIKQ